MTEAFENTRLALRQNQEKLLARANVVATGIGYKITAGKRTDELCVVCSVAKKKPLAELSPRDLVPQKLDGLPTDVVETGPIRAFQDPTARHRPAPGGVSIGHRDITAGTLGCVVRKGGERVILSNNHVLANSNAAAIGDPILQPGPHDGGQLPDDQIAVLREFVPIEFPDLPSECNIARAVVQAGNAIAAMLGSQTRLQAVRRQATTNLVDAAIASPLRDEDVTDDILNIGRIQGVAQAELETAVKKSGRTTGFTEGEILQVDVTVNVQYGAGRLALFTDQLMAGAMSQGGDSGSAVLDQNNQLVGLLFAGSDNSTIINRIENVFSILDLTL